MTVSLRDMRRLCLLFIFFISGNLFAQPAVLQWQKSYGGSLADDPSDLLLLPDGSFLVLGSTASSDGDMKANIGSSGIKDIVLTKFDPAGNLVWQRFYGGSAEELGSSIVKTADGGFAIIGSTQSNDGDVSGNHGVVDVWIIKVDAAGIIQWKKCYGGAYSDWGSDIIAVNDGFVAVGLTYSVDGDVSGNHGAIDEWIFKTDLSGNLIWQQCYGGSKRDGFYSQYGAKTLIRQTLDGNYVIAGITDSNDGNVSNPIPNNVDDIWVFKITTTGSIIWDKCIGGRFSDNPCTIIVNSDGTYTIGGLAYSDNLPGSQANNIYNGDGFLFKLDANGNLLWQKAFGANNEDLAFSFEATPDGGYIALGTTKSNSGQICKKHDMTEVWLTKLDAAANIQWSRTFGGSKIDRGQKLALLNATSCMALSSSTSGDGDLTLSQGNTDIWLTRFSFTGQLTFPSVIIKAEKASIPCSTQPLYFIAQPVNGGANPVFQWKLNGVTIGNNSDTLRIYSLQSTDVISCVLTSDDPCVDIKTATSNNLSVQVGALPPPRNFLAADTALCSFQRIELKANRKFVSYLWSNNAITETINVKQPGIYWLEVTDQSQCTGRDSIIIFPKACIEGIFIPNAFTPNKDGKNDLFMPIMNADVKQYRFIIYDRWGRVVFETTTLNHGWDGTLKNSPFNTGVFAWQCQYQLEGEAPTSKRGTVLLLR
ncbi:T9SS type B sorting domain-containing protein [Ferruginibacter sp.]